MLIKLWCWFWGHRFVEKASTGETFEVICRLSGQKLIGHYYKFEQQKFCPRCGANNPNYKTEAT